MKRFLCSLFACAAASISISGWANGSEREYSLELVRASVREVLAEFSRQTGLQTGFYPNSLAEEGIFVGPLQGHYTAEDALKKLFVSSGLSFTRDNERTITVVASSNAATYLQLSAAGREQDDQLKPAFVRLTDRRFADEMMAAQIGEGQRRGSGSVTESTPANARGSDNDKQRRPRSMEEVVVTAQRRSENLQDVPISITVLGGRNLDGFTGSSVNEALVAAPGLTMNQGGVTTNAVTLGMRGVTASDAGGAGGSPVAYYVDSVPFGLVKSAFVPDPGTYDLDRVEVLRGPQGTLYGASALNGVVRVLTHDADLNEFELKTRASVSTIKGGDESYRADLVANMPIVEGKLAARVALGYLDEGGWIDNEVSKNVNGGETRTARLKLNALPTDQLSIGLSAWFSRAHYDGTTNSLAHDFYPGSLDQPQTNDFDVLGLKVGYEFAGFSVSSMSSYLDYSTENRLDLGPLGDFSAFNGPNFTKETFFTGVSSRVFSEEINVTSTSEGAWRWSAGVFYRDVTDRTDLHDSSLIPAPVNFDDLSKSSAVFGELTRIFLDGRIELTTGLRYFEDRVSIRENKPHSGNPAAPLIRDSATFDHVSPRIALTWHPSDAMTIYGSYAEGFRSGYMQTPPVVEAAPDFPSVKEDSLKNYEIGAKGNFLDGLLAYDVAVYYIDWRGVQQVTQIAIGNGVFNVGVNGVSASGPGFDLAVTARPSSRLELSATFSWNDLGFDEATVFQNNVLFGKGDRLGLSSEYTAGTSLGYVFPFGGSGLEGRFSTGANWHSSQMTRTINSGVTADGGDDILIARADFSIGSPEARWKALLFVDNLSNERGVALPAPFFPYWEVHQRSRTIGLQFEYRY